MRIGWSEAAPYGAPQDVDGVVLGVRGAGFGKRGRGSAQGVESWVMLKMVDGMG